MNPFRRCRGLDAAGRARFEAEGRSAALRFALPGPGETAWEDVIRGRVAFRNEVLDDFAIIRSDGLPTYNYACVVDDAAMKITDVLRGEEHLSNTPRQVQLYRALGYPEPRLGHISLILNPDRSKMSKRSGEAATFVSEFRAQGYLPEALVNYLVRLRWSHGDQEIFTREELVRYFDWDHVGSTAGKYDGKKFAFVGT